MKRVAQGEGELVIGIPLVVGVAVVRVEPRTVGVPFQVEEVRVAVAVRQLSRDAPSVPPPLEFSRG